MVWRVVDNKGCPKQCDDCRRDGHDCVWRWLVIETDGYVKGESVIANDCLVAYGFMNREEAEAYILYPEVSEYPQPRH